MKLERLHEYVTSTVVIGIGIGLAVAAGQSTGEGQVKLAGIIIAGIFLLGLCLWMKSSIWLLIPFSWELGGSIPITNLPFSIHDLAIMIAFGCYLMLSALKIIRYKPPFDLIDGLIVANLCYLATVFIRNPVGLNWLDSDLVGGKPYFDIFVAFLAYNVIVRAPVDLKVLRRLPIVLLLGSALLSFTALLVYLRPSLGDRIGLLYSTFAPVEAQPGVDVGEDVIGRKPFLSNIGNTGMRLWCSLFSPVTFFIPLYPFRFLGTIIFLLAILFSGFRSALFTAFVFIAMSCFFRKKIRDLLVLSLLGVVFLTLLVAGNNRLFSLPLSAQRALSFLPGDWDYIAKSDAEGSSEWRYQIWHMALFEDQWIRNKWLGDGFGFTKYELSIMNSAQGFIGGAGSQEAFLIAGTYHSGPLSTIRYAGVVGLALFIPLAVALGIRSYRLIIRSRGTPLFPVALFIGMPTLFFSVPFIFVAGSYDGGMIELLFEAGLIKLIQRGLAKMTEADAQASLEAAEPVSPTPVRRLVPSYRS